MDMQHAMRCNKRGFITIKYNNLRGLNKNLLIEVCKDVDTETQLLSVMGETFSNWKANASNEARVDKIFDVRVFEPNVS